MTATEKAAAKKEWPSYTWQDVRKNNSLESCWMYHERSVYDVTAWIDKHPGGRNYMMYFAGRDITSVMPAHHVFEYDKAMKLLEGYKIGELAGPPEFPQYKKFGEHPFDRDLQVEARKLWEKMGWPTSVKGHGSASASGAGLMHYNPVQWYCLNGIWFTLNVMFTVMAWFLDCSLLTRAALSWMAGMASLNLVVFTIHSIQHMGENYAGLWWLGRFLGDFWLQTNPTMFCFEHVVGHHMHTNVIGVDATGPDVVAGGPGFVRVVDRQPYLKSHWWQWLYFPLATLGMAYDVMASYMEVFATGKRSNIDIPEYWRGRDEQVRYAFGVCFFIARNILVPHYCLGVWWRTCFFVFFMAHFGMGIWGGCLFLMNHFFEDTFWPTLVKDEHGYEMVNASWYESLCRSSVDYGEWGHFICCGTLNIHLGHHLIPPASPDCLPYLKEMIKYLTAKHGLPYHYEPNVFTGLWSFFKLLWIYGVPPLEKPTLM